MDPVSSKYFSSLHSEHGADLSSPVGRLDGAAEGIRQRMSALAFSKALLVPPLPSGPAVITSGWVWDSRPAIITSVRVWDSSPQPDLMPRLCRCPNGCSWQNQARELEEVACTHQACSEIRNGKRNSGNRPVGIGVC